MITGLKKNVFRISIAVLLLTVLGNCLIDYKGCEKADALNIQKKIYDKKLVYNLPYFPQFNLGGKEALETYFQIKTPFKTTEAGENIPKDGYLVNVQVQYKSPTTPALVFLAASTLTATILPAFSRHDGYDIRYTLYKDGKEMETFAYTIERDYGQWLPLIFVIWLNQDTATERSVFERVTEIFFKDASKYF